MFQIGDKVIYGIHGVCVVVAQEERVVDHKAVTYLALEPASGEGSRYLVPMHNPAAKGKLRRMLPREELLLLQDSEEVRRGQWIAEENLRKQRYRELISSADRTILMQMVHTLYRHKAAQAAAGKKCHLCDENFLRDAEKLLAGEVALVLNISPADARKLLQTKLCTTE